MSHILNCKKNISPENFLICSCPVNLHSICEKKLGCHEFIFFATELRVIGYVLWLFANKIVNVHGNNREIPFVGVVSVIRMGLYPCQLLVCNQLRRQLKVFIFPGVSNCLIVAPAYDRCYETCDKSKALQSFGICCNVMYNRLYS